MKNLDQLSLVEMKQFVEGSRKVEFKPGAKKDSYAHVEKILAAHKYGKLSKPDKGTVRRFLGKTTGLSRAQTARLVGQWMRERRVRRKQARHPVFARRYTPADVELLARTDEAHETLSGPAVKHLFRRAHLVEGDAAYARLGKISVSHIYNLRKSEGYKKVRVSVEGTRSRKVNIAERRRPEPKGRPGYLRVDTVHQGHLDGKPGVYHINAVDTVTQWEVVGCVEAINERHLIPVLEAMLHQFPFRILGFHSDNGSEFINARVAEMLEKLHAEFTKSRANRSTDNAQVEGKNGAVVRKLMGYGPIPAGHAGEIQKFYAAHFNPYLNFHRPCGFATVRTGRGGKRKRTYPERDYKTPYEKLVSLEGWEKHLKPGIAPAMLETQARKLTDLEAARRMGARKAALLTKCRSGIPDLTVHPTSGGEQ